MSLEVSPLLAHDTAGTLAAAKELHARAGRPNLFIKIPGTKEGIPAIEEAIFAGVPINVTLLFSRAQYVAAAEAYLRGIERRIAAGLNPNVGSVASLFVSRWDVAVRAKAPAALRAADAALAHNPFPDRPLASEAGLRDQLGIAVAGQTYETYRFLVDSPRWQRIFNAGARRQRLLWASTGTKDPEASDILYIPFLDELTAAQKENPNFTLVGTMTEMEKSAKTWRGETGFVTKTMLVRSIKDFNLPIYYLSGPKAMVAAMRKFLAEVGVKDDKIRTEEFTGY